jgi:hypothetical protein
LLSHPFNSARYPPYTEGKISYLQFLVKKRRGITIPYLPQLLIFGLGIATTLLVQQLIPEVLKQKKFRFFK